MTRWQKTQSLIALLASISLSFPTALLHAEDTIAPRTKVITDVSLGADGSLQGTIVNLNGRPIPGASLEIKSGNRPLVKTFAEQDGSFSINALRGGVYELTANGHTSFARLWAERTAPPHATNVATLVGDSVVRGQSCGSECQCSDCGGGYLAGSNGVGSAPMVFLLNPIVIGAAVTAAVAIPIALDDDDEEVPIDPLDPAS